MSPGGVCLIITKNANAIVWRLFTLISNKFIKNPLVYQRWYTENEIIKMAKKSHLNIIEIGGISMRLPTYFGDVNDALPKRVLPLNLTKLLCSLIMIMEHKLSNKFFFRKYCCWHLYFLLTKQTKPNEFSI